MKVAKNLGRVLLFIIVISLPFSQIWSDGGYVSKTESIAISADQLAIIIKNRDEISMTFSTGCTGEGEDFGWIIPTPVPPAIEAVMHKHFPPEIRAGAKCKYGVARTKIQGYGTEREYHLKMGENTLALLQKVGKSRGCNIYRSLRVDLYTAPASCATEIYMKNV